MENHVIVLEQRDIEEPGPVENHIQEVVQPIPPVIQEQEEQENGHVNQNIPLQLGDVVHPRGRGRGAIGPIRNAPRRGRPRAARRNPDINHGVVEQPERLGPICSICIDRVVAQVMIPCGHTFCRQCADEINNCGLCRERIHSKVNFFI